MTKQFRTLMETTPLPEFLFYSVWNVGQIEHTKFLMETGT